jgi:hypothetical protein
MIIVTVLILIAVLFIVYSIIDVNSQQKFTERQKVNMRYLIISFPLVGSIIYFCLKPMYRANRQ